MSRAERTFVTRCSFVVKPVDIWTGKAPSASSIRVSLEETDRKPIRTSDGSYAFLDVQGQACTLVIASSTYLEHKQTIVFLEDQQPPVLTVSLLPNTVYAPPSAATGLIVTIRDRSGQPIRDAVLSAFIDDETAVRGRLAEESTSAEECRIRISTGNGRLLPGDAFVVRDREGSAMDWGYVADLDGDPSQLVLDRPFSRSWNRGTRLLPAVKARSDRNGTFVLPFRGMLPASCPVNVEIEAGQARLSAVWAAEGGKVIRLPEVRIVSD